MYQFLSPSFTSLSPPPSFLLHLYISIYYYKNRIGFTNINIYWYHLHSSCQDCWLFSSLTFSLLLLPQALPCLLTFTDIAVILCERVFSSMLLRTVYVKLILLNLINSQLSRHSLHVFHYICLSMELVWSFSFSVTPSSVGINEAFQISWLYEEGDSPDGSFAIGSREWQSLAVVRVLYSIWKYSCYRSS